MRLLTRRRLEEIERQAWQAGYDEAAVEIESRDEEWFRRGYACGRRDANIQRRVAAFYS